MFILKLLCSSVTLLQESISTCRFAQRVAMIKNEALLNEELDPSLVSLNACTFTHCFVAIVFTASPNICLKMNLVTTYQLAIRQSLALWVESSSPCAYMVVIPLCHHHD